MSENAARLRRRLRLVFGTTATLYVLLGVVMTFSAVAQQRTNPVIPVPNKPAALSVPSGSDDKSVNEYFRYMQLRMLQQEHETFYFDTETFLTYYGLLGVMIIVFYFFTFAWYARRKTGDLYPVEAYNGYIVERNGPVDPFNWAVYAILVSYMIYYSIVQILYGQLY